MDVAIGGNRAKHLQGKEHSNYSKRSCRPCQRGDWLGVTEPAVFFSQSSSGDRLNRLAVVIASCVCLHSTPPSERTVKGVSLTELADVQGEHTVSLRKTGQ